MYVSLILTLDVHTAMRADGVHEANTGATGTWSLKSAPLERLSSDRANPLLPLVSVVGLVKLGTSLQFQLSTELARSKG